MNMFTTSQNNLISAKSSAFALLASIFDEVRINYKNYIKYHI